MNRMILSVALAAVACSSSTSPISNIGGHWAGLVQADSAGSLSIIWDGALTQSGSSITGGFLCGPSAASYSVTGQVSPGLMNDTLTLMFVGVGNDTARLTGSVRDSMGALYATGRFSDAVAGQCLSGTGHWSARRL